MGAPAVARPRALPAPFTAVGRTASAVSGIADCGMVVGMTRGRAWIVVLGILLGGIVALNVWGLGMSASSSATAAKIEALQRTNSVLGGRIANRTSNGTIEATAGKLGLAVPAADAVHYVGGGASDAERAAERLANGKITLAAPLAVEAVDGTAVAVSDPSVAAVDPAAVDPLAVEPATTDPAAVAPVEPEPIAPAPVVEAPTDVEAPAPTTPTTGAVTP